jgi:hypothetical protein
VAGTLAALALAGCGAHPIGRDAVPGTTVAIPVPPSYFPGYGLRIGSSPAGAPAYVEGDPQEDPQRGELLFKLKKIGGPEYGYLPRRWITRVGLDEATPESMNGGFQGPQGQVLAFVDIPVDVEDGDYELIVERWRRDPSSPTNTFAFVPTTVTDTVMFGGPMTFDWKGWGTDTPAAGIPIKIQGPAANPPMFTPLQGFADVFGEYGYNLAFSAQELRNYTPDPEFLLLAGNGTEFPAAWELEFDYPIERVRVLSVALARDGASNGIVRWQAEDEQASIPCSSPPGRLKIQVVDPDQQAWAVRVVYNLRNFADTCGARAVPSADFDAVPDTFKAYTLDGTQLAGAYWWIHDLDR